MKDFFLACDPETDNCKFLLARLFLTCAVCLLLKVRNHFSSQFQWDDAAQSCPGPGCSKAD